MIGKYPRTPHIPMSPGATCDDKFASPETMRFLQSGVPLVVTEKMDGGNVTMEHDRVHARSLESTMGPWENPLKALWAQVRQNIPENWSISGESLYARRSVSYDNLPEIYMIFGIWDGEKALAWDEVEEWAEMIEIPTVPVLYRGNDYQEASTIWFQKRNPENSEGFVIRHAGSFMYNDFSMNVAKYVRANHVQTTADWRNRDDFSVNSFQK